MCPYLNKPTNLLKRPETVSLAFWKNEGWLEAAVVLGILNEVPKSGIPEVSILLDVLGIVG